ncbi:MAG: SnoaL-like domain-containing protein [Pseudomonadota bacterium]
MTAETTRATAERLVELCRAHEAAKCLDELYRDDAVSVEAALAPGMESVATEGLAGIRGKHAWWEANFEVHKDETDGPYMHGEDRFGVIFSVDSTHKESGQRSDMKELAVYHVDADGKIFREEFFYTS